ncbi:secreted RxLR effector protein 161-like [Pyrus x bretschneideri]|uniref:secreted RxLR effector protein 161-like n=1 Tax=Pyrus x bretschneideri TaxID=225117 RepID=UPI00202FF7B8|nr:secreted RxLR effector protein 161-like [Pyrus x bretschneideri]
MKDDEEVLEPDVPYLSTINALLYLAQCTRLDKSFAVNLSARCSNATTRKHWNGLKLSATSKVICLNHIGTFWNGYVFTIRDTAISWRSTKRLLVVTSSNHAEILALHEALRECFWLRAVIEHI